jgi:hypothetical protein
MSFGPQKVFRAAGRLPAARLYVPMLSATWSNDRIGLAFIR